MKLSVAAVASDCRPCAKAAAWPTPPSLNGYTRYASPAERISRRINTNAHEPRTIQFALFRVDSQLKQRRNRMKIQGSSALITGGASGLGAATVRMLAGNGAKVTIADLNETAGKALAQELGANVTFIKTDVTDAAQVAAAVEGAVKQQGGLHFLITTAGIGVAEKLLGKNGMHDLGKFVRTIQINLIGTFDAIRHAANAMSANQPDEDGGRGVIVTTASVAAYEGQIGQVAYS